MKKTHIILFLTLFSVLSIAAAYFSIPSGALEVHFFDIGQGDSIFIRTPDGNTMLVDGGPDADVVARIAKALPFWQRRIDLVVATHMDADHIGGLIDVLKRFEVGGVIVGNIVSNSELTSVFWKLIDTQNIPIFVAERGDLFHLDNDVELLTLSPTPRLRELVDDNNQSLVFKLAYKEDSFLLSADAERRVELTLLADSIDVDSDVLKVGHHGSNSSSTVGFLSAITPKISIIQVGENRYGHPHPAVLERLKGTNILRNDINGDIILYSYGDSF